MKVLSELNKKAIYFNRPQRMAFHVSANKEYHVWSRRTGKSHGLTGPRSLENMFSMPRSYGAFVSPSFKMALGQTLPNTLLAWKYFGIYEGLHYVINRKPPKSWGWQTPYMDLKNYENLITFFNGSIAAIISQDRVGTSSSRSLDWIIVDEARFIKYDQLKNETLPAVSGSIDTIRKYRNNPRFTSALYCTDMPFLKKSMWILDFEKQMDKERIDFILQIRKKQAISTSNTIKAELQKMLDELRKDTIFYSEANIFDNMKIIQEKYLRDKKREMSQFEFNRSILNIRPGKIEHGFYPNLCEHHYYTLNNNSFLESLNYNFDKLEAQDSRLDGDLDIQQPLSIACDYNANINWLVAGQYDEVKMRTLKSFYVKSPKRLRELANEFAEYYEPFPNKEIVYYYDSTALNTNYAVGGDDFKDTIIHELESRKWKVYPVYIGNPVKHNSKHLDMDKALKGESYLLPLFNQENNQQLLYAMEQTGIKIGKNGFEKDKSGEKLQETPQDPLELRTDGTDAWDTLFQGINFHRHKVNHHAGTTSVFI